MLLMLQGGHLCGVRGSTRSQRSPAQEKGTHYAHQHTPLQAIIYLYSLSGKGFLDKS